LIITYKRNEDVDSDEEFDSSDDDDDVFVIIPEFNIPKPVEVTFNSQSLLLLHW
ncbi:hypothetical protein A2U01_0040102, partial [Trifolium medium]|nr:hypothetical protein [Trifolium medium]